MSKVGAKDREAYRHMKAVLKSAYKQGRAGLPMYGEALKASNFIEQSTVMTGNSFYSAYQRGQKDGVKQ